MDNIDPSQNVQQVPPQSEQPRPAAELSNVVSQLPAEGQVGPVQTEAIEKPMDDQRPSLARRMHLKLFSFLAIMAVIIFAIFYYQNHSLPAFISSQADSFPGLFGKSKSMKSSTIQQDQQAGGSGSTTQMIVQSVGRSETAYRSVTTIRGDESIITQIPEAAETLAPNSCVPKGGKALSRVASEANCCEGLYPLSADCQGQTNNGGSPIAQPSCDSAPICY